MFSLIFKYLNVSLIFIDHLLTDYEDKYVSSDEGSEFSDTKIYDLDHTVYPFTPSAGMFYQRGYK